MGRPTVREHTVEGRPAITLAARGLETTFVPAVGLCGASIRYEGDEYLSLHGGLDALAAGHTTGLALLHPWANRLSARRFVVDGSAVDLTGVDLPTDDHGLPIHGLLLGAPGWEVMSADAGPETAVLRARFDLAHHPELLLAFPFLHELVVEATVDGTLSVVTTLRVTGERTVPVSFGYHPYFRMPGAAGPDVRLGLPARRHLLLDDDGLPTGGSELAQSEADPIGERTFDDLYALDANAGLWLDDGVHRLTVTYDEGYPFGQVYIPAGAPFAAIEPMTARTDALVAGGCPMVRRGNSFTARFTIVIS